MALTFEFHAKRLMQDVVAEGNVGGFMMQGHETETLFALTHDGRMFRRTAKRPNAEFNRTNARWTEVSTIPGPAEWIGQYRKPEQIK